MTAHLTALVWLVSGAPPQAGTQDAAGEISVANYRISGREIAAKFPDAPGPFASNDGVVEFKGSRYVFRGGKLIRRLRAEGGWSEFVKGYEKAKLRFADTTPEWRIKVFVVNKMDILDHSESGLLRFRRNTFDVTHSDHIYASLARFAAMAEAASGGALKVRIELEEDNDWARFETQGGSLLPSGRFAKLTDYFREYLRPRINGGLFEAEDKVYRGPWDSVFVIHSGLTGEGTGTVLYDAPVTPIAYYVQGPGNGPYGLSLALYDGWIGHLRQAARHHGFRIPTPAEGSPEVRSVAPYGTPEEALQGLSGIDDPGRCFPESGFGAHFNRTDPTTEQYLSHRGEIGSASGIGWADVGAGSLWRLHVVSPEELKALAGVDTVAAEAGSVAIGGMSAMESTGAGNETGLDSVLVWGAEAMAAVRQSGRLVLFVDPEYADFVGSRLKPGLNPITHGLLWLADGRALVVFTASEPSGAVREADLMDGIASEAPALQMPDFPMAVGTFSVKAAADAQHPGFEISAGAFPRRGAAWLKGAPKGPVVAELKPGSFLSFWIKPSKPEPMALTLRGEHGVEVGRIRLFGALPKPAEVVGPPGAPHDGQGLQASMEGDGEWHQVVLPIAALLSEPWRSGPSVALTGITFESDPYAGFWDAIPSLTVPSVTITRIDIADTAPGPLTPLGPLRLPAPSATSSEPVERAMFAASLKGDAASTDLETLLKLLDDGRDLVALNASAAFARIRSAPAEPGLVANLRSMNHRVSEQAAAALAFQGTDTAFALLRRTLEIGPYDYCREFALHALRPLKDQKLMSAFSVAALRPSWRARVAGAEAIGDLAGPDAAKLMGLFMKNLDPAVRFAATERANVEVDDVRRNLLYDAVNDESDLVRFFSCVKLIGSTKPETALEGYKGVRDDSKWVRLMLLDWMAANPSEAHRGALRLAVTDASAEVRAAALRAFAKIPGKVERAEVENAAADPDPRVQESYRQLARAKGIG